MTEKILVAGGGIGGLAAALACARAGRSVALFERRRLFEEVGAGIQLGPNAVRVLYGLGVGSVLEGVAFEPRRLVVSDAASGRQLGVLELGARVRHKYGAPYLTIARADLLQLLLDAVSHRTDVELHLGSEANSVEMRLDQVTLRLSDGRSFPGDALVGADGLWSQIRTVLLGDDLPQFSGHIAYRAMLPLAALPQHLRTDRVMLWIGPSLHAVAYPVKRGDWLNIVLVVDEALKTGLQAGEEASKDAPSRHLSGLRGPLRELLEAIPQWRSWPLYVRTPLCGALQMARQRSALLGDAAHPTRPYLAQGAAMALEDAHVLAESLGLAGLPMEDRLNRYAEARWRRCARIQIQSARNGLIFHARGPLRWGRDAVLRMLGERLLDQPWLYGYRLG